MEEKIEKEKKEKGKSYWRRKDEEVVKRAFKSREEVESEFGRVLGKQESRFV